MNEQSHTAESPGAYPGGPTAPSGNRFFAWLRALDLPRQPGWLGGVAAGIALRLRIDPIIVRGILVVVGLFGAPLLLVYAAAWLLLPDHTGRIHAEDLGRGRFNPALAGIAIMTLLGLWPGNAAGLLFGQGFFIGNIFSSGWSLLAFLWSISLAVAAVIVVIAIARRSGASSSRPTAASPAAATSAGPQPGAAWAAAADGSGAVPTAATGSWMAAPAADAASSATSTSADVSPTTGNLDDAVATEDSATAPAADADGAMPPEGADAAQLAAWHEQQARFKRERDELLRNEAWQRHHAEATARTAEARRLREEQYARYRTERERTRSRPMYTLAAIGLALLTGAATMLAVGGGELPLNAVVAGLAAMLAVLGLAIVLNGIMGRRSGGSSGVAWIVAAALITVSVLSIGARVTFVGAVDRELHHSRDSDVTYLIGAGQTMLDLSDYWEGAGSANELYGSIRVVAGAGDVTITLPDDTWSFVNTGVGAGRVMFDDGEPGATWGWQGYHEIVPQGFDPDEYYEANQDGQLTPPPRLSISVTLGAGDVTIETEGDLR